MQGEKVLDLGCGDGVLTEKFAALGCEVIGTDSSPEMIDAARKRGLRVSVMDGRALTFDGVFDAVFSNAALHWMLEPERVLSGVFRALKSGGRFVGEFGGKGNIASIQEALSAALVSRGIEPHSPWYFPSPEDYAALLKKEGFRVEVLELIARPTLLPGGVDDWIRTFGRTYLLAVPEMEREDFLEEVVGALRPRLCDTQGGWTADYIRLRFKVVKPVV